jgi:Holliday junction resolvase
MSSFAYQKGTDYERELEDRLEKVGLRATRMWGSDGRSRGLPEKVDLVVNGSVHWQLKRPAEIPQYLYPSDENKVKIITENRTGNVWAIMWLFPHYTHMLHRKNTDKLQKLEAEKSDRARVGKDWKPNPEIVAQVTRENYAKGDDLAIMSAQDFRKMIRAIKRM